MVYDRLWGRGLSFVTLLGVETKGTTPRSVHAQTNTHMLSRNATDRVATAMDTKPPDMSGNQTRTQNTADSVDIGSLTRIPMNPESTIAGTPTMTGSHGGITMIRSSQISTEEATADTTTKQISYRIISFNCHGMKSSYGMVLNTMKDVDCMFLCETWLRSNELHTITTDMNKIIGVT
jgi:hypothetical protein